MKCETASPKLRALASGTLAAIERQAVLGHIEGCADCRSALRGAEALHEIRSRPTVSPPDGLFDHVVDTTLLRSAPGPATVHGTGFWRGAGFGALAASLLAAALFFGFAGDPGSPGETAEFFVRLDEPRHMDLAFETDKALDGARITILLSGSVAIDGYGPTRELSWSEDLDAGINRLSLPVVAHGLEGGKMVVRLEHPLSEQVYVVYLPVES